MLLNLLEYHWAEHLDDALMLLSRQDIKTVPLAGGTQLLGQQDESIQAVVDLRDVGLSYITSDTRGVHIGAMTTLQELVEAPVLKNIANGIISHAAKASAPSLAIRNAATIGGTLGAGLQSHSDLLTVFAALDVEVVLRSGSQTQINLSGGTSERPGLSLSGVTYKGKAERRVAFRSLDLDRRPNELILEVVIPPVRPVIAGAFMRAGRTFADHALINAAALVLLHEGKYQQVRLALGGLNMEPIRLQAIERHLEGKEITEPRMHQIWAALQAGINEFNPPSDESVSGVYRRVSGMSLAYRVLEEAMNVSQWRGMVASSEGRV